MNIPGRTLKSYAWIVPPIALLILALLTGSFWIRLLRGDDSPHWLDGLRLVAPLFFIILPVAALSSVMYFLYKSLRVQGLRITVQRFFIGLAIQLLAFVLIVITKYALNGLSAEPLSWNIISWSKIIGLSLGSGLLLSVPTVGTEIVFGLIYIGLSQIGHLSKRRTLVISVALFISIVMGVWGIQHIRSQRAHLRSQERQTELREQERRYRHIYRDDAKQATKFIQLAQRPYRLFRTQEEQYVVIDAQGKELPLPDLKFPDRDLTRPLFIDPWGDRIFFQTKEKAVGIYSLTSNTVKIVPGDIQAFSLRSGCGLGGCTYFPVINGAHEHWMTMGRTVSAGTANIAVFDLQTGQQKTIAAYAGYDNRRVYQFWIEGVGYRLIVNSEGETPITRTMRFYLERFQEKPHEVPDNDFFHLPSLSSTSTPETPWREIAFQSGSDYLKTRTPFFKLESDIQPPGDVKDKLTLSYFPHFNLHALYQKDPEHIALEINQGLLVIELAQETASFIQNEKEIEEYLRGASIIIPDDNETRWANQCPKYDDTLRRQKEGQLVFEGCVY